MSTKKTSHSPLLTVIATVFGTISLAFGINAILNPYSELSFFELQEYAIGVNPVLINALMTAFGAKLIGASVAAFACAYYGSREALGWVMVAGGAVAGVDGWVCLHYVGRGEWNHWGYGSAMVVLGGLLLGVADRR